MSYGSSHNDEEAGRGEDTDPFPIQESGNAQPADDYFRSFIDQETYFTRSDGTQPPNSPPGVFYSIHLPPNSGYHSIRPPHNTVHFRNYRIDQSRSYSDDPNVAAAAADFGHSDLLESLLGSYDAGFPNLREVSLRDGNMFHIQVESSLHENILNLEVNDELYAIGPASGDDRNEMDQTCRKSICSVVSEGQEGDIEHTSLVSVNPPTVESTLSQRSGEQNIVNLENVTENVPGQAASTSTGYQTGTDAEQGRVQPVDNLQTLEKGKSQEPTQHPEQRLQQHLQPGPVDDLQVRPQLSPASVLTFRMVLHPQRNQEGQPGEETDEESDANK